VPKFIEFLGEDLNRVGVALKIFQRPNESANCIVTFRSSDRSARGRVRNCTFSTQTSPRSVACARTSFMKRSEVRMSSPCAFVAPTMATRTPMAAPRLGEGLF